MPEPPSTEALLRGLWSLQKDDLGGLTGPLTFKENQPAPRTMCWWNVALTGGKWTTNDRYQRHCAPTPDWLEENR